MKTEIINFGHDCWQMLTEVPGWLDAPKKIRLRRALPLLIPCILIVLLLTWNKFVLEPRVREQRVSHEALLTREKELDALRLNVSEQRAGELAARAAQVQRKILKNPQELSSILDDLKKRTTKQNWDGSFQPSDLSTGATTAQEKSLLTFFPVRAKLVSPAGNPDAFSALIALLDQFSASEKRIDLTHLDIRADDQGRYTAELNLRLVGRSPDEKTSQ